MTWPLDDLKKYVVDPATEFLSDPVNLITMPISGVQTPIGAGANVVADALSSDPAASGGSGGSGGSSEEAAPFSFELPSEITDLLNIATEAGETSLDRSQQLWDLYQTTFVPGTTSFAEAAFAGIDPSQTVGRAVSSVQTQYDNQLSEFNRQLTSLGIDISSPMAVGARSQSGMALGAARADAANTERARVSDVNYARSADAANLGLSVLGGSQSALSTGMSGLTSGASLLGSLFGGQQQLASGESESALNRAFQTDLYATQQADQQAAAETQMTYDFFKTLVSAPFELFNMFG